MNRREATDIDHFVAGRILAFRTVAGWGQKRLAEAADVSFQQIQKYEKGANRICGSRLFAIAQALGRPVSDFLPFAGRIRT